MKLSAKTTVGMRTGHFSNAVLLMTKIMNLEIAHYNKEKEFAQFILPSGQILEIFGQKSLWRPFTTPPDWEVIVADIRYTKE